MEAEMVATMNKRRVSKVELYLFLHRTKTKINNNNPSQQEVVKHGPL